MRKLNRTELLLVATAAGVLVLALAIPQYVLVDIVALAFDLDITSGIPLSILALVMLAAIAAVAIAYGLNVEDGVGKSGKRYDLNRPRRAGYARRRLR
jgi:hypothetical protein